LFIGRTKELDIFNDYYNSKKSEIVTIYGRRRVGKSSLVKIFAENKPYFYSFEAVETSRTADLIEHFKDELYKMTGDSLLKSVKFSSWHDVFTYVTDRIVVNGGKRRKKLILFFDELQWMAARKNKLISLIKYFWDNYWKDRNVMLILCGSIASFMVKNVINSKALYGRITLEIHLKGLYPGEAAQLFKTQKSREEILKYLLVFGNVPKYLEIIDTSKSFNQNMNRLCFSENGIMVDEVKRIFYNQFKEAQTYLAIVTLLKTGLHSMSEISKKLKIASGGGLKRYLENLELADIIRSHIPWNKETSSKTHKYSLSDEYLKFYFNYIEPGKKMIRQFPREKLFESLSGESFNIYLGFAFERFCIKHASTLAKIMGFENEVMFSGPLFKRGDKTFQIDLIYKRFDKVITVCEIKHYNKEITTKVIPEMNKKLKLLDIPRGYSVETALISLYGPDQALKDTGVFNHIVTLKDILP